MIDRKQLDKIIMKNDTNDWWQPELFVQNTKHLLPTELEILADPPKEIQNYNCFVYVLGLYEDTEILRETRGFIYDSFFKYLLTIGELQKTEFPSDGDYVAYQDLEQYPESITHIGKLTGNKVISKWAWGPLVKHDLWDVPNEYGDDIFYIKSISKEHAKSLFNKYGSSNSKS